VNVKHQFVVYTDNINSLGAYINTAKRNTESLQVTCRKASVEVSEEKTKDSVCLFLVDRIKKYNFNIILPISPSKLQAKLKHLGVT
jgi:hypothetical protein